MQITNGSAGTAVELRHRVLHADPDANAELIERLRADGVRAIALTVVDNGGVTRVKVVPVQRLASALRGGIGFSVVWAVAGADDSFALSAPFDTPAGDLRLFPDFDALSRITGGPRLVWVPADQYTQELDVSPCCQRSMLRGAVERGRELGIEFKAAFEVEMSLLGEDGDPGHHGPGYSASALLEVEPFALDLMDALAGHGIEVEQLHPEYAPGQVEFSCAPRDPVGAADQLALSRIVARKVARAHGLAVSFAPSVHPGALGNGCHLHLSAWRDGVNLMQGGDDAVGGLSGDGAAMVAGMLHALPEVLAVLAPSVLSYARLQPQKWAGAYACWGVENREAALRLVPGTVSSRASSANVEIKTLDGSANPYLALGVLLSAALDGLDRRAELPRPVQRDPHTLSKAERAKAGIARLPSDLGKATDLLARSEMAVKALGPELHHAFVTVRRREWETYGRRDHAELIPEFRLRY
ncbi:glutamine synthetase family protein [Allokutzneria sp. A3M-2-11 16]|uniref:glutamine synthetase family protein n=1 Tax=Allokutzneria sp. A3M-2-11 16 TaxID=2962043 RepID=UPI0020B7B068|nr:glutamine synthetase family protein [Allokutzneria sp. A3M-2-11 16]MCP3805032.1 glutamine synthetase family protein [Allokutzneria sp. A3M-2-11 16]